MIKRHVGQVTMGVALLLWTGVGRAEPLSEYKATVKGTLVGRIEIYQADNRLQVAFAENRSDGTAVITRGAASAKVNGKWASCQHAENASYCQLVGLNRIYRYDGALAQEDRAVPTVLLAAAKGGYIARATLGTGDALVYHATGGSDRTLAAGKIAQAVSNGSLVSFMKNATTMTTTSLTTFESWSTAATALGLPNVEVSNSSSTTTGGIECGSTDKACVDQFGVSCTDMVSSMCICKDPSKGCAGCSGGRCPDQHAVHCPHPGTDEPECGQPGCGPNSVAIDSSVMSVAEMCAGEVFAWDCDLFTGKNACYGLPPMTIKTITAADIQVTTSAVQIGGTTVSAGTPVTVQEKDGGDVYLEVPQ